MVEEAWSSKDTVLKHLHLKYKGSCLSVQYWFSQFNVFLFKFSRLLPVPVVFCTTLRIVYPIIPLHYEQDEYKFIQETTKWFASFSPVKYVE